jgi:predicted O-linked N-acetylglucosamine transferase (SPINDLY family)
MLLTSPRVSAPDQRELWFTQTPALARAWFTSYARLAESGACFEPLVEDRLRAHFAFEHPNLQTDEAATYYASGLLDPASGRSFKSQVNRWAAAGLAEPPAKSGCYRRNKKRPIVGVVTGAWRPGNVIQRNYTAFFEVLRRSYTLVLVALGNAPAMTPAPFDGVIPVVGPEAAASRFLRNDFSALIFTDIGTTVESIVLANKRWCPLQIALQGASSTWGACIDAHITGDAVEALDGQRFYSEKLVRVPGMGVVFERPPGNRPSLSHAWNDAEQLIVNCPWHPQKANRDLLAMLRHTQAGTQRPLLFRFFPAGGLLRGGARVPFVQALQSCLGAGNVQVEGPLAPELYLQELSRGALTLDSFPYGGCNVVVDSLYAGVPVVALRGATWPGRIGAYLVEQSGLPGFVAPTPEAYADIACQKLSHPVELHASRDHLQLPAVLDALFTRSAVDGFHAAFNQLLSDKRSG